MSLPNAGVALSLLSLLRVIDDFTYYDYHVVRYNRGFQFFTNLFYQLTNSKWIPSFLSDINAFVDRLNN